MQNCPHQRCITRRDFLKDSGLIATASVATTNFGGVSNAPEADFYVALSGNDSWTGKLARPNSTHTDGPFRTLGRARNAIRELKVSGASRKSLIVMARGGNYSLDEPFVLAPEDSGTDKEPITYTGYPGERAFLSGGMAIRGWKRGTGSFWTVEPPQFDGKSIYFRQLFVNRERRARARLPKQGYYGTPEPAVDETQEVPLDSSRNNPLNLRGFRFKAGEISPDWANLEDVEVVVLQFWTEARLFIESIDVATRTVLFTGSSFRPLSWSKGYYIDNVLEGLTQPGQWYLNRKTNLLTYWPLPGEDMSTAEVIAPVARQLVRFQGNVDAGEFVEHVILRELGFGYTAWEIPKHGFAYAQAELAGPAFPYWASPSETPVQHPQGSQPVPAAILLESARSCRIESNEITHLGGWGIELARGCKDNCIAGNRISDVGAGAIKVGEPTYREKEDEVVSRTTITDNTIADGCATHFGSPALWIGQSGFNLVSHNEIRGPWEWAVSLGWVWNYMPPTHSHHNTVEYNHIHHLGGSVLGTHGAIYTLGMSPGTTIRHNEIHDIRGGGTGIIHDNGSSGIMVEYNIIYRTDEGALGFNFNALGNFACNNIFALGKNAQTGRYGDLPHVHPPPPNSNFIYRNIFYWKEGHLYYDKEWLNFDVVQDYNLYYDASGRPVQFLTLGLEEWRKRGPFLDQHSIVADPVFADVENGDFTLRPESPAFKLGFVQVVIPDVGPRKKIRPF